VTNVTFQIKATAALAIHVNLPKGSEDVAPPRTSCSEVRDFRLAHRDIALPRGDSVAFAE
jgi:hypothetical protein